MGLTTCEIGRIRCIPSELDAMEMCDGTDEDCDGQIDENTR